MVGFVVVCCGCGNWWRFLVIFVPVFLVIFFFRLYSWTFFFFFFLFSRLWFCYYLVIISFIDNRSLVINVISTLTLAFMFEKYYYCVVLLNVMPKYKCFTVGSWSVVWMRFLISPILSLSWRTDSFLLRWVFSTSRIIFLCNYFVQ